MTALLTDEDIRAIRHTVEVRLGADDGEAWAGRPDLEAGDALVDVLAKLTDALVSADEKISEGSRLRISDIVEHLQDLRPKGHASHGGPTRVRYFSGQFVSVDDLVADQLYLRIKHRLHNLRLHGVGIAKGLEVAVRPGSDADAPEVLVTAGVGITRHGEEVGLSTVTSERLSADATEGFVSLRFTERPILPLPQPTTRGSDATRIEEGVRLEFTTDEPDDALTLARLIYVDEQWRIDSHFTVARHG